MKKQKQEQIHRNRSQRNGYQKGAGEKGKETTV